MQLDQIIGFAIKGTLEYFFMNKLSQAPNSTCGFLVNLN